MRIPCPFCGERDFSEFACLGEAGQQRPDPNGPEALKRWIDAVYLRTNPAGVQEELWFHRSGCRSWLLLRRDTVTHEILAARLAEGGAQGWAGSTQTTPVGAGG